MDTSAQPRKAARKRRPLRWLAALAVVYLVLCVLIGVYLADVAVKPQRRGLPFGAMAEARELVRPAGGEITDVSIEARDHIPLRAWLYTPPRPNGHMVLALHGVNTNRLSVAGYAAMMLTAGYTVLTPDARAHGNSGGVLASYGVMETDDIERWIKWLRARQQTGCLHAFGASMGGAHVLQIVDRSPLCSAIAEAPFATFREVAYDRVGRYVSVRDWLGSRSGGSRRPPAADAHARAADSRPRRYQRSAAPRALHAGREPRAAHALARRRRASCRRLEEGRQALRIARARLLRRARARATHQRRARGFGRTCGFGRSHRITRGASQLALTRRHARKRAASGGAACLLARQRAFDVEAELRIVDGAADGERNDGVALAAEQRIDGS
jgi:pimeloyl-ACP methyl ester carboxylesterase